MKTLKQIIISIGLLFLILNLQSCYWFFGAKSYCKQFGYVVDTNGVGISDVKLTVIETEDWETWTETNMIYYSEDNGYYDVKFDFELKKDYLLIPTHDEYVYPTKVPNSYPMIVKGQEVEENITMVKRGKVKIEGDVRCRYPDLTFIWLDSVKISVLKREIGSSIYPQETGVYTYSNNEAQYYIEFEGDKNYEFFLKPQKEGYYCIDLYNEGTIIEDCIKCSNIDPGYIIPGDIEMKEE